MSREDAEWRMRPAGEPKQGGAAAVSDSTASASRILFINFAAGNHLEKDLSNCALPVRRDIE